MYLRVYSLFQFQSPAPSPTGHRAGPGHRNAGFPTPLAATFFARGKTVCVRPAPLVEACQLVERLRGLYRDDQTGTVALCEVPAQQLYVWCVCPTCIHAHAHVWTDGWCTNTMMLVLVAWLCEGAQIVSGDIKVCRHGFCWNFANTPNETKPS